MCSSDLGRWIGLLPHLLRLAMSSWFASQKVAFFMARIRTDDLIVLKELIEANKVTPVVERPYTLSETPEAIRHLKAGHARGKVVITVEHDNKA